MNWLTLNHYFQAQKFKTHPDIQERIRQANNPLQALCIAQDKLEVTVTFLGRFDTELESGHFSVALYSLVYDIKLEGGES